MKNIYKKIEVTLDQTNFDAISKAWLTEFFKCKDKNSVPKIINESLLCSHKNLDFLSAFKCISTESAEKIYELYDFDLRIPLPKKFCNECVDNYLEVNNVKKEIEIDNKEISTLQKFKSEAGVPMFWVGRESFKKWKNIKLNSMTKELNQFDSTGKMNLYLCSFISDHVFFYL